MRAPLGPAEAHIEVRPVFLPLVAVAARPAARPVRVGERAEEDLRGQPLDPAQQGVARPMSGRNRCHQLRPSHTPHSAVKKKRHVWTASRWGTPPDIRGKTVIFAPESACPGRQTCSVGASPTGVRARRPVAWMAGRRETEALKPIDDAIGRMASEWPGRNVSERRGSPESACPGGRVFAFRAKAAGTAAVWLMRRRPSGGV